MTAPPSSRRPVDGAAQPLPEPAAAGVDEGPTRRQVVLLFCGLLVAMFAASLDHTIFSTALPTIVGELDGVEHLAWVTTAYILAATVVMPAYGRLGDLLGRKWLFVGAIGLFIAGSVVGGLADSMSALIAGRAIQGLGGGGLIILAQAIIADVVPARDRGRYTGAMGAVFVVSSIAGPLLGGFLTSGPGWRWAFWINVPLGLAAIAAAILVIRPARDARRTVRLDIAGMTLLAVATTAVILVAVWGGTTYSWASPQILGLAAVAVMAGALVVVVERRAAEPVLPLSLFRSRDFVLSTTAGLLTGIAMFGTIAYMPTYLQMVTGVDATQAGLLMLPMMAAVMLTGIGSGIAVSRTGVYKPVPVAGSALAGVGLALLSTLEPDASLWLVCGYLMVFGAGLGLCSQILVLVVQNSFPHKLVGTATAANNFFREVGASLGSAVVGSVFAARLTDLLNERLNGVSEAEGVSSGSLTPDSVWALPDDVRALVVAAYNEALTPLYLWLVPLTVASTLLLALLSGRPLATRVQ
ncbi:MAG: MDR family MFS transporter [Dermatophilaceae bacterium]